jgi:DNA-binding transcriptional MerR regulator
MTGYLTLAELAEASGLPARTIRFYISRGLLDGPSKPGRAAAYSPEHLTRLLHIKKLQADGRMLSDIGRKLDGGEPDLGAAPPAAWWQHVIADDVTVWVRADTSPWRIKQVRTAIDELRRSLGESKKE